MNQLFSKCGPRDYFGLAVRPNRSSTVFIVQAVQFYIHFHNMGREGKGREYIVMFVTVVL
jgi:hypothetical protein